MKNIIFFICLVFAKTTFAQSTHWDSLYNYINDSLIAKQRYDHAYILSTQNLHFADSLFGKKSLQYHQTCYQLGQIFYFKKEYIKGAALLSNSSTLLEEAPLKDSVYYGKTLNLLGITYRRMNDNDKAEQTYLKAYKALLPIKKSFQREFSSCLNNLAVLYFEIGRTEDALNFTTQALELTPKNSEAYAARLGTLSLLYKRKGRMKEAIYMAQDALNATDKKHPQYPVRLSTISSLYADMGLLEKAFTLAQASAEIIGQNKGNNSPEYAFYLNNLSLLNLKLGNIQDALNKALQAQKIEETNKNKPEYYTYQTQLADCYIHMGDTAKALPLLLESLGQLSQKLGKKSESYFNTMGSLIRLYIKKGEIQKAIDLNREELDLVKQAWSDTDDRYFSSLMRYIELLNANEQYEESTKQLKVLVEKLNSQVLYNVDVLDEYSKEQFITNFIKNYEPLLFSHIKNNASNDKELLKMALETELAMKGIILSSSQLFRQLATKNPLFKTWEKQKETISKAYMRHAPQQNIDSLNSEMRQIEEKLMASMPELQHIQRKMAHYEDIKQSLKPDACAIEFVRFRYHNNKEWTDSVYYAALVVKPNQDALDCIFLCEENELKTLLQKNQKAQQLYATRGKTRGSNTEGGDFLPSKSLYSLIWQPLQAYLKDIKTVNYTPAGILHQIAIAALPVDETNLLTDLYQLNVLSSTRNIINQKTNFRISNATLYGGINYNDSLNVKDNPEAWQYLAGTKKEITKITSLLTNKNIKTDVKEGDFATEESFKNDNREGASPHVLHLATHGFFYQNKADSLQKSTFSFQSAKNPLIRSGLILAKANKSWLGGQVKDNQEDGILTAYEISNMNLSNTKVVVLSACETGLGDVQGSEGVYGLQRAFKMAGVDYILMSLWKVSDKHTAELMEKFYSFWLTGTSIEEAFHQAQQAMRIKYLPYNWAGFVLMR